MLTTDEVLTIKAVLLYIIKNGTPERCDVYGIVKTAFYAQQIHFAKWATPIFKDNIAALPFGPVPLGIYNILKLARGDRSGLAFMRKNGLDKVAEAIGFENEYYSAKEVPDMDYLSVSNIKCLNEAISKVTSMSFDDIMKNIHGAEWNRARKNNSRLMDNINIAREGGASEDTISYLKETLEFDRIIN